jgi:hypothetical protein
MTQAESYSFSKDLLEGVFKVVRKILDYLSGACFKLKLCPSVFIGALVEVLMVVLKFLSLVNLVHLFINVRVIVLR